MHIYCVNIGAAGFEPIDVSPEKIRIYGNSEHGQIAEEVAVSNLPSDLQAVIRCWNDLPKTVRKTIVTLVKASRKKQRSQ